MLDSIANKTIRTKIGEAHVVQKMNELNKKIHNLNDLLDLINNYPYMG